MKITADDIKRMYGVGTDTSSNSKKKKKKNQDDEFTTGGNTAGGITAADIRRMYSNGVNTQQDKEQEKSAMDTALDMLVSPMADKAKQEEENAPKFGNFSNYLSNAGGSDLSNAKKKLDNLDDIQREYNEVARGYTSQLEQYLNSDMYDKYVQRQNSSSDLYHGSKLDPNYNPQLAMAQRNDAVKRRSDAKKKGDMDAWMNADTEVSQHDNQLNRYRLENADLDSLKRAADASKHTGIDAAIDLVASGVMSLPTMMVAPFSPFTNEYSDLQKWAMGRQSDMEKHSKQEKEYQQAYAFQTARNAYEDPDFNLISSSSPVFENEHQQDMWNVVNNIGSAKLSSRSELSEAAYMSAEQKQVWNYLYNTQGLQAAADYYNAIRPTLTAQEAQVYTKEIASVFDNGLPTIVNAVGSMADNTLQVFERAFEGLQMMSEYVGTGNIDINNSRYDATRRMQAYQTGLNMAVEKAGGNANSANFWYGTIQSILDCTFQALVGENIVGLTSSLSGPLTSEGLLSEGAVNAAAGQSMWGIHRNLGVKESAVAQELSLNLMSTSAMASSTMEAMHNGASAGQALTLGLISGMAEMITEKVSLEALLDKTSLEKSALGYWIKNIICEGSEEVASDIINLFADIVVMKSQSEWAKAIQEYMDQGMSYDKAWQKAFTDEAKGWLLSFAGGGVSGGFMSGIQASMMYVNRANYGKSARKSGSTAQLVEQGMRAGKDTDAYKLASEIKEKETAGKKVSDTDYGKLAQFNAEAFEGDRVNESVDTAIERDLEQAGEQNEAILEAGLSADKESAAYKLASEMVADQAKQTQENYYRLENLNQQEDAQLSDSQKNAGHTVAIKYQARNELETAGKLSKVTKAELKKASTQIANDDAETNYTGRLAVDVENDVGYIDDIGKTLNVYHDAESNSDVITVEVEHGKSTETVALDELNFHNTEVAKAIDSATDFIADIEASDAQKTGIVKSFLQGYLQYAGSGSTMSLKDYEAGFRFLFEAGANGQELSSVMKTLNAEGSSMKVIIDRMSIAQRSLAIFSGQNSQVIGGKQSGNAEFVNNISDEYRSKLSEEKQKNLKANEAFLEQMSRWIGKRIVLDEKVLDSDGDEVNGHYDIDADEYHISANSDADAMAYIAVHETVHDIRANNAEGFLELARVTLRVLDENRKGSADKYYKLIENRYGNDTQEDVLEEVIANTVPVILKNAETRNALAQRMAYETSGKARNAFSKLMEKLAEMFEEMGKRISNYAAFAQLNSGIEHNTKACREIAEAYEKAIAGIHKDAENQVKQSGVKYSSKSIRNAAIKYLEDKIRFSKKMEDHHKNVMTLFSGSGLFEHGMPDHYIPYVACEYDEDVRNMYKANHPEVMFIEDDVNTMDYSKYKGKISHMHISPCCQQFSAMNNKRSVLADNARDRMLASSSARGIAEVEAPLISVEQVRQYEGSESEAIILKALDDNGYKYVKGVFNAGNYGAYTSRERYWILAAKDFQPSLPPENIDKKQSWKQCLTDDIIDQMEDSMYPDSWIEKAKKTARVGVEGHTLDNLPEDLLVLGTAKGGQLRCAFESELCPTILAGDDEARIIRKDGTVKKVRAKHLAMLMGLDNYVFQTNDRTGKVVEGRNIHAIGNGIPTQMTNAFMMSLQADEQNAKLAKASEEATEQSKPLRYMELAENEDRTEAEDTELREMIDQAAAEWGALSNKKGKPIHYYHGTPNGGFNVFDMSKAGTRGTQRQSRLGMFFSEEREYAEVMARSGKAGFEEGYPNKQVYDSYLKIDKPLRVLITEGLTENEVQDIERQLSTGNYDGILDEIGNAIVLSPEQIKSADLVTRDDNGNIIPLSQRFNTKSNDIRFSKKSQEDPRINAILDRINEARAELIDVRNQMKDIENSDAFNDVVQDYMNIDIDAVAKFFRTSGYDDLETRKNNLQEELNKLSKQYGELQKEIALAEEREAIEKSGLSERDWRRKQAIKEFGYTPYYYDAGYMLPDGKLLNFSGEKGRHFGSRGQDHRGISSVYATYDDLSDAMIDFMNGGNIRIMDESPGIDISNVTELTAAQYAGIRKYARTKLADDVFYVDVSDENGRTIWSKKYDNVSADRVVADIKGYFDTGKVPGEDTVASFHQRYSIKSSQLTPEMIAELDNDAVTALNVNQAGKLMYATNIAKKAKIEETRESPIRFIGKDGKMHLLEVGMRVGIVATGKNGGGKLIAYATVSKINVYNNADEFHNNDVKDENGRTAQERHLVPENSKYDIKEGGVKYGYEFDSDSITELKTPIPTVWNGPAGTRKLDIVDSIDYKELIIEDGGRKFIDYDDRETADRAVSEKHKEMLNRGIYHDVNDIDFDKYQQYFDDNGRPNKELFDLLRKDINNDLEKSYYQFKISIGNSIFYTAEAGHSFATHAVPLERAHIKPIDAAVFTRIRDVIGQMEYVYSSYNDDHKANFVDSDIWDYFYTPVKGGNRDRTGVLVGIRRLLSGYEGNNHQIYSYKKKKQLRSTGSANITTNVGDTNRELSAAIDIVPSNESTVNTTGSKIRESRKSSVSAIEQAMLENEKMKQYIGSASKLAKLGITATGKQASMSQARTIAGEVKKMFGSKMNGEDIARELVKAFTPIAAESQNADEIISANEILMDLSMKIAKSSTETYRPNQYQYDLMLGKLNGSVIQLTKTQVGDVKHKYGSVAEYNRLLYKAGTTFRVTVTKSKTAKYTTDLDSFYKSIYEELGLDELNESDQPSAILEALESYGEQSVAGQWENLGMSLDDFAGEIYGELATRAAEARLESLREIASRKTGEAMTDVNADHQAEIDSLKADIDKMKAEKEAWHSQLSKEYAEGYDAAKAEVSRRIADLEEAITMLKEESRKKLDEKLSKQKAEDKLKYKQAVDKLKSQLMKLRDQMKTNQQRDAELLRYTASLIGTEKHLGEWRKNLAVEKLKNEFRTAIAQAIDGDYKGMMDAVTSYTKGMQGIRNKLMGIERKGIKEGKLAEKQAEHHRKTRAKIATTVKDLASRLVAGNDRTAIPEIAREPITQFVSLFLDENSRKGILNKQQAATIITKLSRWYDAIEVGGKENKGIKNQSELQNLFGEMYDIDIAQDLMDLENALSNEDGSTVSLAKLDQDALDKILRIAQHLKFVATHADDARKNGKKVKLSELGMSAIRSADNSHRKNKTWSKLTKLIDNNITPYYFFKRLGGVWSDLYKDIDESTRTYVFEVEKATQTVKDIKDRYHYDSWSHKKDDTIKIRTLDGAELELTRELALSIYATRKREISDNMQEANHLMGEGIRLADDEMTTNHPLTWDNIIAIDAWLTDEQRDYADAMVAYMSGELADIGNETSLRMFGYKKFLENYYFPFGSNRAELYEEMRGSEGKGQDDARIKHAGFTKKTTKFASSGLLIKDFTNVCANHISQMLLYGTMTESLETMNRVFNWQTPVRDESIGQVDSKISVKSVLENTYGSNVPDYIRDFMKDVNGGTSRDRRDISGGWLLSAFKRSSVMASLSVVIQQPSAIGRALAYIDPKYFVGKNTGGFEQAKKYAYTAVLKDVGGFDVAMGHSMADHIVGGMYEKSKLKRFDDRMNDIAGYLPQKADELTWGRIWNAVKRETKDMYPGISGEDLLEKAGRRFDHVINATQVYDNQLSKSGNMRARDWYMKVITSFMAEPTVSFNMLYDAVASAKKNPTAENKKAGARAIAAVATSMVLNSILKSIVSALRHKKDDEPYVETYVGEFIGNLMDEANPFGMLPLYRDIWSLFQGYDVSRADMSVVESFSDSVKGFVNLEKKEEPTTDDYYKAWKNFIGSMSKFTSIPVANVWRDMEALYNSIAAPIIRMAKGEDLPKPDKEGFHIQIESALSSFIPFTLYRTGNSVWQKKAGKALASGDTDEFENRMRMYEVNRNRNGKDADTDSWASEAIKSAKDKLSLDEEIEYLQEYAGKDGKKAYETAAKWETGTNSPYDRLYQAIGSGNFDKVLKEMVDAGYEEKNVRSQVKSYIRDSYKGKNNRASISAEDAESKLIKYAGMTRDEAHSQVMNDNCYRTYGVEYDKADDAVLEGTLTMAQYRKILKVCGGLSDADIEKAVEKLNKKLYK